MKMTSEKFNKIVDWLQELLVWFVVSIVVVCIMVLILFDVLAGTGTMYFLTNGKEWQSVVLSLATTGLLFSLMFVGYIINSKSKDKFFKNLGRGFILVSGIIYIQDIVFDSLLADILRYGTIIKDVDGIQWMFRGLIGGISVVGTAMAIAMIMGMPVLKTIISQALGEEEKNTIPERRSEPRVQQHFDKLPKKHGNNGLDSFPDKFVPSVFADSQHRKFQVLQYVPDDHDNLPDIPLDYPDFLRGKVQKRRSE